LVAVAYRAGGQRGEVGSRVRLGVTDREMQLPVQDLGQEEVPLLVGPELHDRLGDRVDGEERDRNARAPRLVHEDVLLLLGATLAPVLLGPPDAQPAVMTELANQ